MNYKMVYDKDYNGIWKIFVRSNFLGMSYWGYIKSVFVLKKDVESTAQYLYRVKQRGYEEAKIHYNSNIPVDYDTIEFEIK